MNNVPMVRGIGSQAPNEMIQLVSFELGGEEYGVDVLTVREIIRIPEITKMPNSAEYVDGIISLRGKVVPIISLRRRFGLSECERGSNSRILVMDVGGGMTGFIVDSVSEVIRIQAGEIQPPPALVLSGGLSQEFITGVFNHAERLLITMDVDRMFSECELDNLGGNC